MEGPRAAKPEELPDILKLINATFPPRGRFAFHMESKFPLFLSQQNLENIWVIYDQGKPVSVCSYYPSWINVRGCLISAASIGAVCTEPSYRGQGLSSRLLDVIEEKAAQEDIDLLLISGTRGLYLRRNCVIVGGFIRLEFKPDAGADFLSLDDYTPADLQEMANLYNHEPVRFERTREEFDAFLQAGMISDYNFTYRVYLTHKNGQLTSYIVLRIVHKEPVSGSVVEYAGNREDVLMAVRRIARIEDLPFIQLRVHQTDPLQKLLGESVKPEPQEGTVKILRPLALMQNLRPYFLQSLLASSDFNLHISKGLGHSLSLSIGEENLDIESPQLLSWLIFGFPADAQNPKKQFYQSLAKKPGLKSFFASVFPIPFPYTGNLNYI